MTVDFTTLAISAALFAAVTLGYSWVVLPWLTRRMDTGPIDGFALTLVDCWMRLLHRPRWRGFEAVQRAVDGPVVQDEGGQAAGGEPARQGVIIIANHASGLDPFLLQMPLRRRIRWMMAQDQMLMELAEVWDHLQVLPVTYGPQDAATFREAMRHVQAGGLLGIFPEGGIAKPAQELRPFLAGVGLIVARAKVPVVVCWIDGAPDAPSAIASLFVPSRVTVHCLGMFDFRGERDDLADRGTVVVDVCNQTAGARGVGKGDALADRRGEHRQLVDRGGHHRHRLHGDDPFRRREEGQRGEGHGNRHPRFQEARRGLVEHSGKLRTTRPQARSLEN